MTNINRTSYVDGLYGRICHTGQKAILHVNDNSGLNGACGTARAATPLTPDCRCTSRLKPRVADAVGSPIQSGC